jgi:hypothetical protein
MRYPAPRSPKPTRLAPVASLALLALGALPACGAAAPPPAPATPPTATTTPKAPPQEDEGITGGDDHATDAAPDMDWRPGKYMQQAVANVAAKAQYLQKEVGMGFDGDASCLLGAYLDELQIITMTRDFEAGVEYVVVGGGSEGTEDLDIEISTPGGKVVTNDLEDDATPVARFKAPGGELTMKLGLAKSSGGGQFAAIAIMRADGGFKVPVGNMVDSIASALVFASGASTKIHERTGGGLVFHAHGDWSFFGTILKQGETIGSGGYDLQASPNVVLVGTDKAAQDVDLELLDQSDSDRSVAKDSDADANPLLVLQPKKGHQYKVRVTNVASKGPTLITAMVLATE